MTQSNTNYDVFLEKLRSEVSSLKIELMNVAMSDCSNYGEIERFLQIKKKIAAWDNELVLLQIINEVLMHFNEKKNGLSDK